MSLEGVPKQNKENPKSEFIVGARRNPDGTMNYSKALHMKDFDGSLAHDFEAAQKATQQQRKEKLSIPEDVKPGTTEMVMYNLSNAMFIQEEIIGKNEEEMRQGRVYRDTDIPPERRYSSLKKEKDLLREAGYEWGNQPRPIADTISRLEGIITDIEKQEDRDKEGQFKEVHMEKKKIANGLLSRLADEAAKGV